MEEQDRIPTLASVSASGPGERSDSVSLTKDAKGNYKWDIKIYFNSRELTDRERALGQIQTIDERLRENFLT